MINIRIYRDPIWLGLKFRVAILDVDRANKTVALLENFTMRTVDTDGAVENTRLLEIESEQCQKLIDELWDCGFRPSEGSGSAGQLESVKRHLEDMRAIAFKKSGVEQPKK